MDQSEIQQLTEWLRREAGDLFVLHPDIADPEERRIAAVRSMFLFLQAGRNRVGTFATTAGKLTIAHPDWVLVDQFGSMPPEIVTACIASTIDRLTSAEIAIAMVGDHPDFAIEAFQQAHDATLAAIFCKVYRDVLPRVVDGKRTAHGRLCGLLTVHAYYLSAAATKFLPEPIISASCQKTFLLSEPIPPLVRPLIPSWVRKLRSDFPYAKG